MLTHTTARYIPGGEEATPYEPRRFPWLYGMAFSGLHGNTYEPDWVAAVNKSASMKETVHQYAKFWSDDSREQVLGNYILWRLANCEDLFHGGAFTDPALGLGYANFVMGMACGEIRKWNEGLGATWRYADVSNAILGQIRAAWEKATTDKPAPVIVVREGPIYDDAPDPVAGF